MFLSAVKVHWSTQNDVYDSDWPCHRLNQPWWPRSSSECCLIHSSNLASWRIAGWVQRGGCEVCAQTTSNFKLTLCAFSHPEYCGVPTCTLCEDLPSRAVSLPPALLLSAYCLWVICCSLVSTSHVEWSHELQIWQMLIYRLFLSHLPFLTSSVLIWNSYIVWVASHVVDCSLSVSLNRYILVLHLSLASKIDVVIRSQCWGGSPDL